jgi:hypothetical protein
MKSGTKKCRGEEALELTPEKPPFWGYENPLFWGSKRGFLRDGGLGLYFAAEYGIICAVGYGELFE